MNEPARPLVADTPDGKATLQVTAAQCVAFGMPATSFSLDLTGMGFFLPSVFPTRGGATYVSLYGPPGGPLRASVVVAEGEGHEALADAIRKHAAVSSPNALSFGPKAHVLLAERECAALAFQSSDGPSWRPSPGGCAVRLGPVILLLEAEGFDLDVAKVLAHADLGAIARGFRPGDGA